MQQWFSIIWYPNQYSLAATGESDEDGDGVAIGNTPTDDIIEEDDWVAIGYTPTDNIIEEGMYYNTNVLMIWIFEHHNNGK